MKITVFGATGGTGRQIIEQALASGYQVVAYARNPSKLNIRNELLTIMQGELSDQALIEQAVSGAGAVISTLGPRGGSKGKTLTEGMRNIIAAMRRQGVRRLIISSTLSARDPNDQPELRARILVALVKLTMHAAYEEIVGVAEAVRASDLDWTIVRLTLLNDKPRSGKVRAGYMGRGEVGTWISRSDVADFMLRQIGDTRYLRQAPAISN